MVVSLGNRILSWYGLYHYGWYVVVEDDVFIGAGSLVVPPNKRLISGYLYVGNPMKQVRRFKRK